MTHTRQFAEHEGKLDEPKLTGEKCPRCPDGRELHQSWDSSDGAYTDSKYTCTVCPYTRWVDGDDG